MEKFQPVLPQSNASPFIAPGVSDTSMATLVSGLGKLGVAAYTGYVEAGLEEDIEGVTQDYFNNQNQYEEGKLAGIEAQGLRKGLDEYWKQEKGDGDGEIVTALETGFKAKMETYTAAMKQGRMTADQLYSRIIATTKEHASRNPWLQRELLKTADDYLELTGLGGYIKTAQKSAKEEADFQKKFIEERMTRADKLGLQPFSNPNWNADLQEREAGSAKLKEAREGLEYVKDMLPEQASAFLTKARPVVFPAVWTNLQDSMIAQMNAKQANGQPIPWEQQKFNIRREALQFKDDLVSSITRNNPRLLTDPNVSEFIKHVSTTVEELNKAMNGFGSGEDAMNFAKIQYNTTLARQQQQLAGIVSVPYIEAFNKLMTPFGPERMLKLLGENSTEITKITGTGAALLAGMVAPNNITHGTKAINMIIAAGKDGEDTSTPLGQSVQTMIKTINDPNVVKDLNTKVNTISSLVGQMADVGNKDQFAAMSPTDRAAATTVTAEYIDAAKALVDKNLQKLAEDGVVLNFSQQADGSVILTYAEGSKRNDEELKRLNSIYPGHINNAIKAYTHLAGRTDYNQVLKDFFLGEDGPGNKQAWYARTPADAFDLFEKGTIDEVEYMELIKMMKGKPVDTIASGAYPSDVTTSPDPSIPVVTSKALLEPTPVVQPGISLELAKDLREKKPKAIITPQQESTKKAIENLGAQDKGFKASPMMKRNPAIDAIAPTTVTEAMIESLGQVHPAAGMAAAAALVAFGGVKGAPALAKLMPKLLKPAGKVTTGSNVALAGGNVGANKAIVTSILAAAEKTKKARMESLYKEYWKTGWQKDRMELPKTDVEWSQAIVQANEYVARKMNPEMFKTMKGK